MKIPKELWLVMAKDPPSSKSLIVRIVRKTKHYPSGVEFHVKIPGQKLLVTESLDEAIERFEAIQSGQVGVE